MSTPVPKEGMLNSRRARRARRDSRRRVAASARILTSVRPGLTPASTHSAATTPSAPLPVSGTGHILLAAEGDLWLVSRHAMFAYQGSKVEGKPVYSSLQ